LVDPRNCFGYRHCGLRICRYSGTQFRPENKLRNCKRL
jgi:hypothetical protein